MPGAKIIISPREIPPCGNFAFGEIISQGELFSICLARQIRNRYIPRLSAKSFQLSKSPIAKKQGDYWTDKGALIAAVANNDSGHTAIIIG